MAVKAGGAGLVITPRHGGRPGLGELLL
jgi:hypothetical protein